jgi:hypothetical protein
MNFRSIIKIFPDSGGYEGYANTILESSAWWHQADLNTLVDITLFRMPLYPWIIAAGKFLFGEEDWIFFVALLQFLMLIASAFSILALMKRLDFQGKPKIFMIIAYLTGLPLFYSLSILTDSLFTSLGIICLCSLSIYLLEGLNRKNLAVFSLSLFLMCFLRETSFYYALSLLPFSLYFLHKRDLKGFFKCVLVILVPVLLSQIFIRSWNYYRTGEPILTTGLVTGLVAPQLDFIAKYPEHRYALNLTKYLPEKQDLTFPEGTDGVANWIKLEKLTTSEAIEILKKDYYKTLLFYPKESLSISLKRIPLDIAFVEINPFFTLQTYFDPHGVKSPRISRVLFKSEKLSGYPIFVISNLILMNIFRILSVFVFLLGIFKIFQRSFYLNQDPKNYIYLSLFVQSIMWIVLHAVFHLEIRYIMTSIFIFTLLGLSPQVSRRSLSHQD